MYDVNELRLPVKEKAPLAPRFPLRVTEEKYGDSIPISSEEEIGILSPHFSAHFSRIKKGSRLRPRGRNQTGTRVRGFAVRGRGGGAGGVPGICLHLPHELHDTRSTQNVKRFFY